VPNVNPVIELVNEPTPVPLVVFVLKAIVGLGLVLQQIPLAVTGVPPSLVIVPPLFALDAVIEVIAEVVMVGNVLFLYCIDWYAGNIICAWVAVTNKKIASTK
jgi:hypothetical protein